MLEKLKKAMGLTAFAIPGPLREVIFEMGAEIDRLRQEISELRSASNQGE
ncbi:hypothetical protein [Herbaspirillum robiniae]|nr:hypothetical protein [Herbaspirillum robiniae]